MPHPFFRTPAIPREALALVVALLVALTGCLLTLHVGAGLPSLAPDRAETGSLTDAPAEGLGSGLVEKRCC